MWTNGFWGGLMWQMYIGTQKDCYKQTAEMAEKLMDDAFALYKRVCVLDEREELQITGTSTKGVAKRAYYYPLIEEEKEFVEIRTQAVKNYNKRKKEGEIVGKFEIYLAKRLLFSGNLYKL